MNYISLNKSYNLQAAVQVTFKYLLYCSSGRVENSNVINDIFSNFYAIFEIFINKINYRYNNLKTNVIF